MRGKGATGGVWGLCTPWQNHYMLQLSKTCEKKKTVLWITLACVWDLFCVLAYRLLQRRQRAQKTKNYVAFALAGSP